MSRGTWKVPGIWFCFLMTIGIVCVMGCMHQEVSEDSRLQVAVTILPQEDVARAVGGDRVCVTVVVPPGVEPHTYEPSAGQIVQLSRADMYFRLGPGLLPFEDALVDRLRTLNPDLVIIVTSSGIPLIQGEGGGNGTSRGADPHIWLSPSNLRLMAENMAEGFFIADPAHSEAYIAGKEAYLQKVDATDRAIRNTLSGTEGRPFLVFHPAWGYFAREYNLEQVSVEAEGKEPGIRQISMLIEFAVERGIRVVFADPQFSTRESEVIAREINGTVVLIDPLAPDTLANIERVASVISMSYGKRDEGGDS